MFDNKLTQKGLVGAFAVLALLALASVGSGFHSGTLGPSIDINQSVNTSFDTTVQPGETVTISSAVNTTDDGNSDYEGPGLNVTAPAGWNQDPVYNDSFTYKNNSLENGQWTSSGNPGIFEIAYNVTVPAGTASGTYTVDAIGSAINNSATKETASDPLTLTVNRPPIVAIAANKTSITEGETVGFNNSSSTDPDGNIVNNSWEFGPGEGTGSGASVAHTYSSPGTYQVNLTVTDDTGVTNTTSVNITVNDRPNVAIAANKTNITEGETIAFDNSTSTDTDGNIVNNSWEFGPGEGSAFGASVSHTYSSPGSYQVNLTVTDNDGATNTTSITVNVNDRPNVALAANKTTVNVSETIAFNNSTSSDTDGNIVNNSWDFGDGNTANGASVTHSYSSSGTYTVTLNVTDNDGASNTTTTTITVNGPPIAAIAANTTSINEGETIGFNNSTSSDPDGNVVNNSWEFGPGEGTAFGASVSHTYTDNGSYQVNLTVTDDNGLTNTTSITITVNDDPKPVIDYSANDTTYSFGTNNDGGFQGPDVPSQGETIEFTGRNSFDVDGSISSYSWDLNGTSATGVNATNTFATVANHTVNLTVTDDNSATNFTTNVVQVRPCRQRAIANYDSTSPTDTIELTEIQFGIAWWQTNSIVPGAGEQIQNNTEIQWRIDNWVSSGSDVAC